MNVEIWRDVMCPFFYIGKRKFENALTQFPHKDKINIIWKSFQLDPTTVTDPSLNTIDNLAEKKGWSKQQAQETTAHVTNIAKQVVLEFNFDKAVVANSFDAHRLSHLAKKHGKQNDLEEKLLVLLLHFSRKLKGFSAVENTRQMLFVIALGCIRPH